MHVWIFIFFFGFPAAKRTTAIYVQRLRETYRISAKGGGGGGEKTPKFTVIFNCEIFKFLKRLDIGIPYMKFIRTFPLPVQRCNVRLPI